MKAKEYIIQKLVELGKKYRWMKYPMLAVVSLISLIFLALEKCLERPRRAVIALVCLVLIISQSWYLISVANDPEYPETGNVEETANIEGVVTVADESESLDVTVPSDSENPDNGIATVAEETTYTIWYRYSGNDASIGDNMPSDVTVTLKEDGHLYKGNDLFTLPTAEEVTVKTDWKDCFVFTGWYNGSVKVETADDLLKDNITWGKNGTVTLNPRFERVGYRVTYSPGTGSGPISSIIVKDGEPGKGIMAIPSGDSGYRKTGYTYVDNLWLVEGRENEENIALTTGSLLEFSQYVKTYGDTDITLVPKWIANQYTIYFSKGSTEIEEGFEERLVAGSMDPIVATYDKDVEIPSCKFTRQGYVFDGWVKEDNTVIPPGTVKLIPPESNLTSEPNGTYTLTAKWRYRYGELSEDEISRVYGDTVNVKIYASHENGGGGDFEIRDIEVVSGTTVDGEITDFAQFTELTGLVIYEQKFQNDTGEYILIDGQVKTVGEIVLKFTLYDTYNNKYAYPELKIILKKRELEVYDVGTKEKTYDGTTQLSVGVIRFRNGIEGTDIYLHTSEQDGRFSDPNAGENKDIIVENIYVYDHGSDTAKYYTVPDVVLEGIGTIKPKGLNVSTFPVYASGQDHILTGQKPSFTVEINEADIPVAVVDTDKPKILAALNNQSIFSCNYGAENDYHSGTYLIDIKDKKLIQNYDLIVAEGTLKVIQEDIGEYDYRITGSHDSEYVWWYDKEPRVIPYSATYDSIYVLVDGNEKYTYDKSFYNKDGASISEEMAKDGSITIQLGNSSNGAVTAPKNINIRVDVTAPKIDMDGIQVSTKNTGAMSQIGRFLSFGNFFKETVVITIPVYDALSGPNTLTYFLEGTSYENGISVPVSNDGPNTGTVSIEVAPTYKGTIALLATDKAGNTCTKADMIGVEGSNWWVVENTAPEIVDVNAVDEEGKQAYFDSDLYYKSVTVTVTVEDLDAGVEYLEWDVTKDGMPYTALTTQYVDDTSDIVLKYDFKHKFTESGTYDISVTAYDNAGNVSLTRDVGSFNVDGIGPEIQVTPTDYDDVWATEKTITFTITDTGSGIAWWSLTGPDDQPYPYTAVEGEENTYTFTVTAKGIYTIQAVDGAGNTNTRELTFERVSSEVPETPKVETDIEAQASGWFTTKPTIMITGQDTTSDGTAVYNYYQIWAEGEEEPQEAMTVGNSFKLPGEGIYNIRVWAVSESGMQSAEQPVYQVKYDGTAPEIQNLVVTGKGTITQVTFQVAESTSGLAKLEVVYNDNFTQPLIFTEISPGVYSARFTTTMAGKHKIRATDVAGNTTAAEAFDPMNIIVTYVSGNADSGIKILGKVLPGTFDIASVEVKYGSFGMGYGYAADELLPVTDEDGSIAITAMLTNVEENTIYYFRIIATSTTGEVCEYSGSFRTGALGKAGANVVGTVIDETALMQRAATSANISVMLYDVDGNIVQSIYDLASGQYFMFREIPDGIYTIRATNGSSSVTQSVIIENGIVVAPEGQLKLVLRSGQKTDVEYEEGNSLHFVVDGLTDLFDDSTNFGDKERDVIEQGGTIEFCMTIDELSESEVPESDRALILQSLGKQERVLLYVDFSIWKRASFAYGLLWEEQVTAIAGGKSIQIVIPLVADWVGLKNLSVIRVHGNSVDRLPDLDENPNTYTISSTLFSTYALVYTDETISTEDPNNSGDTGNGSQNPGNSNGGNNSNGSNGGASGSTSDISKVPNNNNNLTSNGSGSTPRTGDEAPILWVSILGLAAGILGSLQLKRRK